MTAGYLISSNQINVKGTKNGISNDGNETARL